MKDFKYLKKHKALTESKVEEAVNENVLVVNDGELFKVSKIVDVPKKLINALIKKAKDESGKDPKIFWNEVSIADEIVKYIIETHLNAESLPASILMGETSLAAGSEVIDDDGVEDEEATEEIPADLEIEEEPAEEEEVLAEEPAGEETAGEDVPSLDSEEDLDNETEEEAEATEEV